MKKSSDLRFTLTKTHLNEELEQRRTFQYPDPLVYWRTLFDFGYYGCIVPFRFTKNQETGYYCLHTNYLQKVILNLKQLT